MPETAGLTSEEAAQRLVQDGPNLLPRLAGPPCVSWPASSRTCSACLSGP
ncbi:MAG: hypothetical protein H7311_09860 [Ramlibacter sp.]|nr:hypothetical protein [Cryobacterium sp.]